MKTTSKFLTRIKAISIPYKVVTGIVVAVVVIWFGVSSVTCQIKNTRRNEAINAVMLKYDCPSYKIRELNYMQTGDDHVYVFSVCGVKKRFKCSQEFSCYGLSGCEEIDMPRSVR